MTSSARKHREKNRCVTPCGTCWNGVSTTIGTTQDENQVVRERNTGAGNDHPVKPLEAFTKFRRVFRCVGNNTLDGELLVADFFDGAKLDAAFPIQRESHRVQKRLRQVSPRA